MPADFGSRRGLAHQLSPDLREYAQAYISGDVEFYRRTGSQAFCNYPNLPTTGAVFAGKAYDGTNGHKWFYDAETVIALLRGAGFVKAESRNLHESSLPQIQEVEPAYRVFESFYVEGVA